MIHASNVNNKVTGPCIVLTTTITIHRFCLPTSKYTVVAVTVFVMLKSLIVKETKGGCTLLVLSKGYVTNTLKIVFLVITTKFCLLCVFVSRVHLVVPL